MLRLIFTIMIIIILIGFVSLVSIENMELQEELLQCNKDTKICSIWKEDYRLAWWGERNNSQELQKTLNIYSQQIENLTKINLKLEQDRASLISELTNEYRKYNELTEKKGITRATYNELKQFLREDKTNEGEWIKFTHDCTQFASELMNNSWNQGIQSCVVELEYPYSYGHDVVYFPLSDREGIFIEPREDLEINGLKKGVKYCNLVDWNCDYNNKIIGLSCPCCE